jgi:hypothetical protein
MSTDLNTADMNMDAGEPGMVTAVMMMDTAGRALGHLRWFPGPQGRSDDIQPRSTVK